MELSSGRKLYEDSKKFHSGWLKETKEWEELGPTQRLVWEELAAEKEAKQHEKD